MNSLLIEDDVLPLIKEGVLSKRKTLERSLRAYEDELKEYEEKFQMPSTEFETKVESGLLGDEPQ